MKRILLVVFILSIFSFSKDDGNIKHTPYFEGQVVYDIEYTSNNDNIPAQKLMEFIGSKMVLTFKKGDYKKEYFSPSGLLLQERILNLKKGRNYLRAPNNDTIYWVDITKHDTKTSFSVVKDTTILDHHCKIISTKSIVPGENFGDKTIGVEGLYIYAQDLPVNPEWYSNYLEGNFNEIIEVEKGIAIETTSRSVHWEQRIKLKSVIKRKVKNKEIDLKITRATPLKEL